ncbi:hypothetical protein LTR94_034586, partial [Friedmanniomyces endolithicus]
APPQRRPREHRRGGVEPVRPRPALSRRCRTGGQRRLDTRPHPGPGARRRRTPPRLPAAAVRVAGQSDGLLRTRAVRGLRQLRLCRRRAHHRGADRRRGQPAAGQPPDRCPGPLSTQVRRPPDSR